MTSRPIVPRQRALQDVDDAIGYYVAEAGADVALDFIDMLENAYRAIADRPAIGSPRFAHELDLPGLRTWRLHRYPYLIFYMDSGNRIDIWRGLHAHRDIPTRMQEPDLSS